MAAAPVVEVDAFVTRNSLLFSVTFSLAFSLSLTFSQTVPFSCDLSLTLSLFLPDPFSSKFSEIFFLSFLLKSLLFQKFLLHSLEFDLLLFMDENRTHDPASRHPIEFVSGRLSDGSDLETFGPVRVLEGHQPRVRLLRRCRRRQRRR